MPEPELNRTAASLQTWEFSIPIPYWILAFFHIKGGLIIVFEISISAHQTEDYFNIFNVEMLFRQYLDILYPKQIEDSRIVLGYLWPNPYYQVNEEEIIHVLSRVSLATGVTASEDSTYTNTPSLLSTPEILPQSELPVPPNHFTLGLQISSELQSQLTALTSTQLYQQQVESHFNRSPLTADLTVDQVFARIQSGVDLDQPAFREGNITYWNLQNIDRNANPQFYTELSNAVGNNYEQPCLEDSETMGDEEEEEQNPLLIPGPSGPSPIHLMNQELEQFSSEQLLENTNDKLDTLEQ